MLLTMNTNVCLCYGLVHLLELGAPFGLDTFALHHVVVLQAKGCFSVPQSASVCELLSPFEI